MKVGTQIIYVPLYAEGDILHPGCEEGFVTSIKGEFAYCRYWNQFRKDELRTKANSECTPLLLLVEKDTHDPKVIEEWLWKLGYLEGGEV